MEKTRFVFRKNIKKVHLKKQRRKDLSLEMDRKKEAGREIFLFLFDIEEDKMRHLPFRSADVSMRGV